MEKYPYDEWIDGNPHILRRGEHFDSTLNVASFENAVRYGFKKRGFKVRFERLDFSTVKVTAVNI